jgi:hypothetical protein
MAAGTPAENISSVITDLFYNAEEPIFAANNCYGEDDPNPDVFEQTGHFTQMVWCDTTHVGCYTAHCGQDGLPPLTNAGDNVPPYFTVCNYRNPGMLSHRPSGEYY